MEGSTNHFHFYVTEALAFISANCRRRTKTQAPAVVFFSIPGIPFIAALLFSHFSHLSARAMQIENKYACQYGRAGWRHIMQIEGRAS